jgi:hypothetical protein
VKLKVPSFYRMPVPRVAGPALWVISNLKQDFRLLRCFLKGFRGDQRVKGMVLRLDQDPTLRR